MKMPLPVEDAVDSVNFFSTDPGIPFHLLRRLKATQPFDQSVSTATQFINNLGEVLNKFNDKVIKDNLSSFLPHLPGYIDSPGTQEDSLQQLVERPPIGGRELLPLSESALQSFRLMPGSVPDQFKFMNKPYDKKKKKKHKHSVAETSLTELSTERKHKKRKREEGDKKKKEKKKKRKKDKKAEQGEV
ncbi:mediator of RNA polymerase II transcription subunit 19 isoform X1 [Hydra vulgaris]|uniref:Mediator of RNA polymerase II transcription subunit 19 n=1 Tax=Hydra vulgaris TaxID=6087 RepID=T2MJ65_HYDVU|nr:mediator of RNA polymerase II transcription subunit 19-like isoform X2 [Hydra vulgaris]